MQRLRERIANRQNHARYCSTNCRKNKTKERHREIVAADGTKRKDQRKLVKTKSSMAKDRIVQAAHKPKVSEKEELTTGGGGGGEAH